MSVVTLGGDRLGAGKKQKVELRNYERSSHDLSYVWRSTMASGTLVPFMTEVALPGDSFDINLDVDIKTHPTIGPLFGSYKVQLDVFQCPIRLYNGKLHMNMLNIGMKMADIKLPQIQMAAPNNTNNDNGQINPSSIYSYLNIRGLGKGEPGEPTVYREFNGLPYLMYWDIYKNYYANKQEEIGAVIHNRQDGQTNSVYRFELFTESTQTNIPDTAGTAPVFQGTLIYTSKVRIIFNEDYEPDYEAINLKISNTFNSGGGLGLYLKNIQDFFQVLEWDESEKTLWCSVPTEWALENERWWYSYQYDVEPNYDEVINIETFPLENIDIMRQSILSDVFSSTPFMINQSSIEPYNLGLRQGETSRWSKNSTQEGLGLKTYQSDLFNNWISTEWLDGPNGVNEITSVDTSSGSFSIDTLQLSKKVYDMLNRIAVSGGTYDDWLDAVYTHERTRSVENPMYMGGLIKELAFQEVISNAAATTTDNEQPLGTLAGRGVLTRKHKGGEIKIKVDEPSYIMGIISLTPRIDYSQGNKWDVNLKTMDDFHKPALDEIGFQELITDQMAWWDTRISPTNEVNYKSAGKQPAWVNYMTNVNVTRGNFANQEQMFMTLNRRYEKDGGGIKDLTTYIDPRKFNHIFADTRIDAQNFWAQIGVNIYARRKMSAKLMPNL
jgi:hypothetical protein